MVGCVQWPLKESVLSSCSRHSGSCVKLRFQHARGRWVLVIDGDIEVDKDWLVAALQYFFGHPDLAGIGGVAEDVNLDNIEFRARKLRKAANSQPGEVDWLYGAVLYRREAIDQVGYLNHRSLSACEELELDLGLQRLDQVSIRHHGHQMQMWILLRWRSRYVNGAVELLCTTLGKRWFWRSMVIQTLLLAVLVWWATLAALCLGLLADGRLLLWSGAALLSPVVSMMLRKRGIRMGLHFGLVWWVEVAGILHGFAPAKARRLPHRRCCHRDGYFGLDAQAVTKQNCGGYGDAGRPAIGRG
jgi:hypothetical protein